MGALCLQLAGVALWHLGHPERALARCRQALDLARELAHQNSLGSALFFLGYLHVLRREPAAARPPAEALLALAEEHGFPFWAAGGTAILGWTMAETGHGPDGIARMREGLAAWRTAGTQLLRPLFLPVLAEACGHLGTADEGLRIVEEALFFVSQNAELMTEAEIHRVRGELLCAARSLDAEPAFRYALEIARHQGAPALALRAATSLGRLLADDGRGAEVRRLLGELHAGFTEGHDTPDLRDAAALLIRLEPSAGATG